jgi:hypothetical protein
MGLVEVDVVTLAAEFPNDNPALHRGVSWLCLDVTGAAVPVRDALIAEPIVEVAPIIEVAPIAEAPPIIEAFPVADVLVPALVLVAVEAAQPEPEPPDDIIPPSRISGIVAIADRFEIEDDLLDDLADEAAIVVEELPPLDETASLEGAAALELSTQLPAASDDPFLIFVCTLSDVAIGAGSPHVASVLPELLLHGRLEHALPADAAQALAESDVVRGAEVTAAFVAQTRAWRAILLGTSDDFAACGGAMLDEWAADLLARLLGAPSRATALRRELRSHGVAAFGLVEAA